MLTLHHLSQKVHSFSFFWSNKYFITFIKYRVQTPKSVRTIDFWRCSIWVPILVNEIGTCLLYLVMFYELNIQGEISFSNLVDFDQLWKRVYFWRKLVCRKVPQTTPFSKSTLYFNVNRMLPKNCNWNKYCPGYKCMTHNVRFSILCSVLHLFGKILLFVSSNP
jgi:hypothetical protein